MPADARGEMNRIPATATHANTESLPIIRGTQCSNRVELDCAYGPAKARHYGNGPPLGGPDDIVDEDLGEMRLVAAARNACAQHAHRLFSVVTLRSIRALGSG